MYYIIFEEPNNMLENDFRRKKRKKRSIFKLTIFKQTIFLCVGNAFSFRLVKKSGTINVMAEICYFK